MRRALFAIVLTACAKPPETKFSLSTSSATVDVRTTPPSFVLRNAEGIALVTSGNFAATVDHPTLIDQIAADTRNPVVGC